MKQYLILAALLLCGCQPAPKAPDEFYLLGNDGLNCDTRKDMFAQMYIFIDANPAVRGYIFPQCRFAGKGQVAKILERGELASRVLLDDKEVWVMGVSLQERAGPKPKYQRIPLPEPVLTEMKEGKQYL